MTFKECKKKYPLGLIMGTFSSRNTFLKDYFELKKDLFYYFCPESFYYYDKENKSFYQTDFLFLSVKGYVTTDGMNFYPYGTNSMDEMVFLDNPIYKEWFRLQPNCDNTNESFAEEIDKFWLEKHPNYRPIRTVKDLENFIKYDF
jgi:hypothetical protein